MAARRMGPLLLLFASLQLIDAGTAWALTVEETVTPESVKENPKLFSVKVEKKADGLIHFSITLALRQPSYLAATTEIRDGDKLLSQNTACAYAREASTTYYLAIAPQRVADLKFSLFQGSFVESGGQPVAMPGGTEFRFDLGAFAKAAMEGK